MDELAPIRERLANATPGPWQWVNPDDDRPMWVDPDATFRWSLRTVAENRQTSVGPLPEFIVSEAEIENDDDGSDRDFIAHAPEDIATLLAACAEKDERITQAETILRTVNNLQITGNVDVDRCITATDAYFDALAVSVSRSDAELSPEAP